MRQLIDQFLDTSTPTGRCLAAVVMSTPFMCAFWLASTLALVNHEIRQGVNLPVIWGMEILLTISLAVNVGMGRWLWVRRHLTQRLATTNLLVALNIGLAYQGVTISYGFFSTGGSLVMLGVLTIGLLLFDQRTMLICFAICLVTHLGVDFFVMKGDWPYAPAITAGAFEHGQPTWWWSLWRSLVLMTAWAALLPLIFMLFGRLDTLHNQLAKLSYTDVLTGLANRRFFMERLKAEAERQSRSQLPFSLVLIDADHFKRINDQHGHAAGDEVLRHLADLLIAGTRTPTDQSARLGGEEFGVLLPDTDQAAAQVVCQRIAWALRNHEFEVRGQRFHVTVSMGVVECLHADIDEALKQADMNLYQAKHQGRDAIVSSVLQRAHA